MDISISREALPVHPRTVEELLRARTATKRKQSEQVRDRRYTGCPGRARLVDGAAADWPDAPTNREAAARRITAAERRRDPFDAPAVAKPPLSHLKVAIFAMRARVVYFMRAA